MLVIIFFPCEEYENMKIVIMNDSEGKAKNI